MIFTFFLKQARVGAEKTSSGKSFQIVGSSKAKLWPQCFVFVIYVQMDRIEEAPSTFHLNDCILYYSFTMSRRGPRWESGNTLASHLCGRGSIPIMAVSGKAGSCLPLVGSLQYTTLANSMYWFPLPFQLPVVI